MAQPIRCDVCGKLLSSSTLRSHKRLAHAKAVVIVASDDDAITKLVLIFKTLSDEKKEEALAALAGLTSGRVQNS